MWIMLHKIDIVGFVFQNTFLWIDTEKSMVKARILDTQITPYI